MAKVRTQYVCQNCGYNSPRYLGRCPNCGEWNTLVEEQVEQHLYLVVVLSIEIQLQ